MGLFMKYCAMCDVEIDFLGEDEVCPACKPFSKRFLELKEEKSNLVLYRESVKDFLSLILTKIVKFEHITEEDKETFLKFIDTDTSSVLGFNYYSDVKSFQQYYSTDYAVIFSLFKLFDIRENNMVKRQGYLNYVRECLENYIEFHEWDTELCDNQKVVERINNEYITKESKI